MLLFDFDGVMADSLQIYTDICTRAARCQGYQGNLPANPFAELEHVTFEALAETLGLCPSGFAADATALLEERNDTAPAFASIIDTLKNISTEIPVGILSASPKGFIERFLTANDITDCISVLLSRSEPGTKAEKIMLLRREGHFRPIALVGDGVSDVKAAATAGIASIGVTWGWQSPEKLLSQGATFMAGSPDEIQAIAMQLWSYTG